MDASLSHEPTPADGVVRALAWLGGLLATGVAAVFAVMAQNLRDGLPHFFAVAMGYELAAIV